MTGTHERDWIEFTANGERVEFTVVIFFPWDRDRRLFKGEKVYVQAGGLANVRGGSFPTENSSA